MKLSNQNVDTGTYNKLVVKKSMVGLSSHSADKKILENVAAMLAKILSDISAAQRYEQKEATQLRYKPSSFSSSN